MDRCPKCNQNTLPPIRSGSIATARACQNPKCRYVEEFKK